MLSLIKTDIRKFNLKKQPLYFILAVLGMAALIFGILYATDESAPVVIDVLVKPVFIVWEAVLTVIVIIDEFRNKTILMLYTYPLNKKKLIISKVLIVLYFSLAGIISSQILLNLLFYGFSQFIPQIHYELVWRQVIGYGVSSIMVILLGLIPLAAGLVKYSTVATMVSAIMIIVMGSSSGLGFDQLLSQISVVSVMGIIGAASTIYSVTKIFKRDLIV